MLLPRERWTGWAWMGIGTDDERPVVPHAAGAFVFGMSLGVAF